MKYILILLILNSISLFAQNKQLTLKEQKEQIAIQKAIDTEKRFAKEQKFYQGSEYDLKSQEVDMSTIDSLGKEIDSSNDDFDMDDVY